MLLGFSASIQLMRAMITVIMMTLLHLKILILILILILQYS